MAEQLSRLDIEVSEESGEVGEEPESVEVPEEPEELSDEELFRQAVEELDPAQSYEGKYRGKAGASLPEQSDSGPVLQSPDAEQEAMSDEERRQKVQEVREAALFEQMVGRVNPLKDRDKYKKPARPREKHGIDEADEKPQRTLVTPELPRTGNLHYVPPLDNSQRALLERHRRYGASSSVPEIHLRGDDRAEAIDRLATFVEGHHRRGKVSFVRVIHGRGLRSQDEPVLKPSVLGWLEGAGSQYIRGYVPERLASGDYGSLVVELRSKKD